MKSPTLLLFKAQKRLTMQQQSDKSMIRVILTCVGEAECITREVLANNFKIITQQPTLCGNSFDLVVEGNKSSLDSLRKRPWLTDFFVDTLRPVTF